MKDMKIPSLVVLAVALPWQTQAFSNRAVPSRTSPLHQRSTTSLVSPLWQVTSVEEDEKLRALKKMDPEKLKAFEEDLMRRIELESENIVTEMMDEDCEIDYEIDAPPSELCDEDSPVRRRFRDRLRSTIKSTLQIVRGTTDSIDMEGLSEGEVLEMGWEQRANAPALVRNAEVWKFVGQSALAVVNSRKLKLKEGVSVEELKQAQTEAAEFIRDGLLRLGPSFVKLGQVASTRTDVLPETFTDVLKTLTDNVPGFSGARAKEIVTAELGIPCDKIFQNFSEECVKAASLGQVHTALYKGQKVAVKVQRAGLKELFDIDLKNLKKLASLLDKFDPKSDGADRNWVEIYEESERLLYLEIDYLNEAKNTKRFAKDFKDFDWVRIPRVIEEVTTPRILVMEFVESFKLTEVDKIDKLGLDRKLLAKRVAEWFLRQIVETSFFHADPHSGNLCVNEQGQLVVYDYGQMDELKPNVREGFRTFCTALFSGGPTISDLDLAKNAKKLIQGVQQAGVLSKSADTLAVEKLARYFMRTFKDKQLGKSGANIKETVGTDLQTLTENNSFRFPSTFTFIFRAFASVDGIGKDLDKDFDLGKLGQPFIEKFIDEQKGYKSDADKNFAIFQKATGLNLPDINKAISQPRKVDYIEETIRSMESGSLKIRVRSLETEKALERMGLRQSVMENVLFATLFLNLSGLATRSVLRSAGMAGGAFFLLQTFMASTKLKKFDKTQLKFEAKDDFNNGEEEDESV
jgi:predicted unusual protein kinase regulating ubiquinone biosynthesis (AarF/ABC1/UbiB family)